MSTEPNDEEDVDAKSVDLWRKSEKEINCISSGKHFENCCFFLKELVSLSHSLTLLS
jgi:hypothetical protein